MMQEINHKNNGNLSPVPRVLFIITQSEMGGAQRFLYNFLNRTADKYKILVATGSDGSQELTQRLNTISVETTTLKFLKREMSPLSDIRACYEIKKIIQDFKPDTLFLLSSKAGFIGSLTTRYLLGAAHPPKIIYRIGGWTFNDPWPKWKKRLWTSLEKRSAKWKDIVIVNNNHDLEQAKKIGIKPKNKIVLIHNGIDPYKLDFLSNDEAKFKLFEKLSRYSGKIFQTNTIIGTVANLYSTKGLKYLIEAAEHFKNNEGLIFVVIGDGKERVMLENMIREKGLTKNFFILGQIPDAHKLMPAFDIFVLPSVKEGFPWAIIEAMAAKIPVIATRVGAIPEIIENGKNGFIVESANPAALAGKIKELLANDHLRQELSIQGHQTVLFNFTEDKMIREIEILL